MQLRPEGVTFDRPRLPLTDGYGTKDRTNFKPVVAEPATAEIGPRQEFAAAQQVVRFLACCCRHRRFYPTPSIRAMGHKCVSWGSHLRPNPNFFSAAGLGVGRRS